MISVLRTSVDNMYIDPAGLKCVWPDFGDWEVSPESLVLKDVIGCGNFGIVWKGKLVAIQSLFKSLKERRYNN